jgi:hypothetical protein
MTTSRVSYAVTATAFALCSQAHAADLPLFLACDTEDGRDIAVLAEHGNALRFSFGDDADPGCPTCRQRHLSAHG